MKKNALLITAVAIVFGGAGVALGHRDTVPQTAEAGAVGALMAQSMPDVQGKMQPLAQWRGKTLLVNFWATWCAPCVDEMPELSALQRELSPRNVQIVGIGIDSPSNIAAFAKKYRISYPLYVGGMSGTELSRQLGNQAGGLPFTALIDREGKLRKTFLGRLKMDELRKELDRL